MKKILLGLVVCAGFCACSNDDVVVSTTTTPALGGDGYISLAINLPTTGSTRANDVYDDGIAAEYNVNDATLYLFGGNDESSAVLYASYPLTGAFENSNPANDNITSRHQYTQQITRPASGSLYALVVVNGTGVSIANGASLSDLQSNAVSMNVATIANVSGANFYMTNAPLWHGAKGGYTDPLTGATVVDDPSVTTLAYIDSYKIYDTATEAEDNPATEIYVERGVAKVTVNGENAVSGITGGIAVSVDGFCLDLTNLTGYAVRNTTTSNGWWEYASSAATVQPYRFVGNEEVGADLYRTYWAIDPNYSTVPYDPESVAGNRDYSGIMNSLAGEAPTGSALTAADGVTGAYCLENTFNVAHQNKDETTRAIVAVTLGDGSDFFVFEGVKSTLYTEEQILNEVLALFAANGDVQAAEDLWIGANTEDDLYSHFTASIDKTQGATDATVNIVASGLEADYFKDGVIPAVFTTEGIAAVVAQINADNEFSYYAGGVAYYPVLIKHFGDDLTPWAASDAVNGDSYPGSAAEANWLGRYGVLRNNWYDVQVTAVNDIGSADVPTAYGEQDDPTQSWISVEINILSWAKRTQSVEL